ncbi:MAG: PTS transporter subunit EIIC, partial [Acidobacteriota bacterium]|nr:PTS transporter subunit EIIC [Acidobacteriota bacterium]
MASAPSPHTRVARALTALSENTYLSATRAGMVAVVPLTIVGGLFLIVAYLPVSGWEARVAPYLPVLQIPVTATFGMLAVFACLAIAYDLGRQLKQEPIVSASIALVVFLMLQIEPMDSGFRMEGLGSRGLFTA